MSLQITSTPGAPGWRGDMSLSHSADSMGGPGRHGVPGSVSARSGGLYSLQKNPRASMTAGNEYFARYGLEQFRIVHMLSRDYDFAHEL
jgi:hypothetical protein